MTELQNRVNALVERVEKHQKALKLSDTRFVTRYQRYIGSTKTWRDRLCARDWKEFGEGLEKWERRLNGFVAELDGGIDLQLQVHLENLPIARYGVQCYEALQGQHSDRRVAWLIGPTGVGKSWTMRHIAHEQPAKAAYLHVNRGAKDSLMVLSKLFARYVGSSEEISGAATFQNVVEAIGKNPMTFCVDDVHEGGVLLLKLIKHLVDDTRAKFILGTYPTAWRQLLNGSSDAHSEAQQLIGRSIKPVNKTWTRGLTEADVEAYLKLTLGGNGECRALADRITSTLNQNGNLRTLADAVELAQMNADDVSGEISVDLVERAILSLCPVERK